MAKSNVTFIALFCFFTLSLASHTPLDNNKASTQVTVLNPNDQINTEKQFNTFVVSSAKWTKIPFRTVNCRFSVRSKLPCRHHRKFRSTAKNYGNDMIFPTGENSDFEAPVVTGEGRWFRLHHHRRHQNQGDDDGEAVGRVKKTAFKRYVYDLFDKEEEMKGVKKMKDDGVMKKKVKKIGFMSKFLDQYF